MWDGIRSRWWKRWWSRERVAAPDGTSWTVGRKWLPRPPRSVRKVIDWLLEPRNSASVPDAPRLESRGSDWGGSVDGIGTLLEGGAEGGPAGCLVALLLGLAAVVLIWVVVPVLVFALDLLLVLLIAAAAVAGRVLFRRPWTVVARSDARDYEWAVVGWKASGRAIHVIEQAIRRGTSLDDVRIRLL